MSKYNKLYRFKAENMVPVLDRMKGSHPFIEHADTNDLCEIYRKLFKPVDGMYEISIKHVFALVNAVRDKALLELVDMGHLDLTWDPEKEEFAFILTDKGREEIERGGQE